MSCVDCIFLMNSDLNFAISFCTSISWAFLMASSAVDNAETSYIFKVIFAKTHTHIYTHACARTHTHVHEYTSPHVQTHVCVCMHTLKVFTIWLCPGQHEIIFCIQPQYVKNVWLFKNQFFLSLTVEAFCMGHHITNQFFYSKDM